MVWKRFWAYIFYLVLFLGVIFLGLRYQAKLRENEGLAYHHLEALSSFFPLIIGMLLAAPHIFRMLMKKGCWKIDWIKLIVIGLPFLYITIVPIMYMIGILKVDLPFASYAMGGYFGARLVMTFITINGIVAGYMVCTSFYKQKS